jgi:hypothetical protein
MEHVEWRNVEVLLRQAKGLFFDGCHGIYIAMDDGAVDEMTPTYRTGWPTRAVIDDWRDRYPCPHQFVCAVWTADEPRDGVLVVVPERTNANITEDA